MPIDHFCMCISCGRYEDTLCPGKSRKFPTRKDPRPVGFEPTTLSLVLLNSCAFTATAIWVLAHFLGKAADACLKPIHMNMAVRNFGINHCGFSCIFVGFLRRSRRVTPRDIDGWIL
uniref:Putative conserved plasma membrane protein n=1 Tax=Aedes aegypti TaxID=7159 RepID=A0A0P6J164_AEDAE